MGERGTTTAPGAGGIPLPENTGLQQQPAPIRHSLCIVLLSSSMDVVFPGSKDRRLSPPVCGANLGKEHRYR